MKRLVTLAELGALLEWEAPSADALRKRVRRMLAAFEISSGVTLLDRGKTTDGRRWLVNLERLREIKPDLFLSEDAAEASIEKLREELRDQKKRTAGLSSRVAALEALLIPPARA